MTNKQEQTNSKKTDKAKASYSSVSNKKKLQTAGVRKVVGGGKCFGQTQNHNEVFIGG